MNSPFQTKHHPPAIQTDHPHHQSTMHPNPPASRHQFPLAHQPPTNRTPQLHTGKPISTPQHPSPLSSYKKPVLTDGATTNLKTTPTHPPIPSLHPTTSSLSAPSSPLPKTTNTPPPGYTHIKHFLVNAVV